jgi:O-antigen/teichoic acid export membrane protein
MSARTRLLGSTSPAWGGIDQALSSGTNFALMIVTVRSVDVREFGTFSLVYLLYVLMLPIARSTGTMPFTIRHARTSRADAAAPATRSLSYAFALGLVVTVACLVLALVTDGSTASSFLVLGLCFPLLLVQDAVRGVMFVRSEFLRATVNDGVWAVVMVLVLTPVLLLGTDPSVTVFVAAWAGSGAVAGVFGLFQLRSRIRPVLPTVWLRDNRDLARPLFLNTVFTILPAQLTYLLMPLVSSVTELGEVRAAYVLFGVLNVVYTTVAMVTLPYASRIEPSRSRTLAGWLSGSMALIAVAWGVLVMSLPDDVGRAIIGSAWDDTETVRLVLAISLVAEGATVGAQTVLASLKMPERMARVRYVTAPLTLVLGLSLAAWNGALGVAIGFAIGYGATAVLGWLQLPSQSVLDHLDRDALDADGAGDAGDATARRTHAT